jgi:formylmethanofuran dehydrogenase subunit C
MITLTLKDQPNVPLEAEVLSPDVMAALANDEIRALPVYLGKRRRRLDDFFSVEGNAADWAGAEMSGGVIRIRGNAGGQVGAAYRGSLSGMTDGTILIDGTAGLEVGMRMKRGMIAIGGLVRDFAGLQMKGGTIVLRSGAELRTGAWMVRGTIISLTPIKLLPTFSYASTYNPTFLRLYAKHLATLGFPIPYEDRDGAYQRYAGDTCVPGKGEILVWQPSATSR